jgi:hypothetical protein
MDLRRASRIAEWVLIALVIGLHAAVFLWPETSGEPNLILATAHDAQLLSGIVLVLAWAILGPGWLLVRCAALPVLVLAWLLPWNTRMLPRETTGGFQWTVAIVAAAVLVSLWLCGQRVRRREITAGRERGAQFSLLGLILATTLIAATIGGLEALRPTLRSAGDSGARLFALIDGRQLPPAAPEWASPRFARQSVMAAGVAFCALGGFWILLRPGAIWFRLVAIIVAVPTLAAYLTNLSDVGNDEFRTTAANIAAAWSAVALTSAFTALPLRLLGYRLQRNAKAATAESPSMPQTAKARRQAAELIGGTIAMLLLLAMAIVGSRVAALNSQQMRSADASLARWIDLNPWDNELSLIFLGGLKVHPQPQVWIDEIDARAVNDVAPAASMQGEWTLELRLPDNPSDAGPGAGESP